MLIKHWRKREGLTLDQTAARIGAAGPGTVHKYESGRVPEPSAMRRIIAETGATVTPNDWFQTEIDAASASGRCAE